MTVNRLLEFTRDSSVIILSGNLILYKGNPRVQIIDPNGAGRIITLPDSEKLSKGGPYFYIVNVSTVDSIAVNSFNGADTFTIPTEKALVLGTFRNTGNKMWFGHIRDFSGSGIGALAP